MVVIEVKSQLSNKSFLQSLRKKYITCFTRSSKRFFRFVSSCTSNNDVERKLKLDKNFKLGDSHCQPCCEDWLGIASGYSHRLHQSGQPSPVSPSCTWVCIPVVESALTLFSSQPIDLKTIVVNINRHNLNSQ